MNRDDFDSYWIPEPFSGCHLWIRGVDGKGYGAFVVAHSTNILAHRVAWSLKHGEIPARMRVLHRCDTPLCVNPDHLFLGTDADNVADCVAKGRKPKGIKHGMSRLLPENIREIRVSPEGCRKLASRFGVSKTTVQRIRHRRLWKHL